MTSSKAAVRRYRIRWNVFVARLSLIAALSLFAGNAIHDVANGLGVQGNPIKVASQIDTVVVQPGDSLWSIAMRATQPGQDGRQTVEHIRTLNGLTTAVIHPGSSLLVPAAVNSDSSKTEEVAYVPRSQTEARRRS